MAAGSSNPTTNVVKVAGTAVDTNTGNASAGTQRVVLASNQPAIAVTGTFYQATQPVSGTFYQATQPVSIASMPSTPVTGTFWQATQPVSIASMPTTAVTQSGTWTIQPGNTANTTPWLTKGYAAVTTAAPIYTNATDAALSLTTAGALRVDGSGVTQPVSLASVPTHGVTGTFWQATQPVSIASMPSTPVTGTFWQTTQPVSIASMPTTAVTGPLTNTELRAAAVPVSGTFWQTTQPVSGTVTVSQATAANLNATVTGTVELGATSLAALENISITVPGTVDLGNVSLTALETISVTNTTPSSFQSKNYGAVTTAAPAYTTGTDNALSLTTSGALRVDGSGVTQPVSIASSVAVTGTFYQATQPVSIATMPTTPVTGTFWQTTQPVSAAALPLPTGAATAAKQPALGTAGTASADVITVQGVASMTALKVDGSAVTQPVSGNLTTVSTVTTVGAVTAITNALPAGTNVIGTVNLAGATTNALTNTTTTAYAASLIIKASAGTIYTLNGYNSKTSGQFIQLHNSATLPADAAVPVVVFYVPASSNFSFDWGVYGRAFSNGIVVTTSSTGPTKTIGAADCWFDATSK